MKRLTVISFMRYNRNKRWIEYAQEDEVIHDEPLLQL